MVYYNEFDEPTAHWLKGLCEQGLIPQGVVDTRSIVDVDPEELKRYTQCHFFAGIGGWAYALNLANAPKKLNIYTGSCPCQPFSNAGKKKGMKDDRNLWKVFYEIIARNRPTVVIGEQADTAIGFGWLDIVCEDLEASGYSTGSAVLTASMLGSPHTRRRLYWGGVQENALEDSNGIRLKRELSLGDKRWGTEQLQSHSKESVPSSKRFWDDGEWHQGTNGKGYLFQPRDFPLVNGVPNRVLKCRGYGNAIVPQVGAMFINALIGV